MFSFKSAGPVLALSLLLSAGTGFAQGAAPGSHEVEVQGELEVLIEDHKDHAVTHHYLKSDSGRTELHFKGKPTNLLTGAKVKVKGRKSGDALEVAYLSSSTTSSSTTSSSVPNSLPNTLGAQKTLVLLVNFEDDPTNKPWTVDQVQNHVFGKVSNFFLENSYQQTWLTGDVHGWYTIPAVVVIPGTNICDQLKLASDAKAAAANAGVDLSAYAHYVYAFPNTRLCQWSGASTVGGNPSSAWINGYLDVNTYGHELGHSLGLDHSHSWNCNPDCTTFEYGDTLDIMGSSSSGHFDAYQKERLGWLNGGASPPITTVQTSGTYALDPYVPAGTQPKALKILKGTDPATGKKTWYYVEFRQANGFDAYIATSMLVNGSNILNGVVIHTGNEDNGDTSHLLDMTPETYDLYPKDPALIAGRSFTDGAAGLTITATSISSSGATVSVSLNQAACVHANPGFTISPSQSQMVAAGTAVAYTVTATNKDGSDCGTGQFALSANVPSGWTAVYSQPTLNLDPGASASTTLTVTSPSSAAAGSYSVWATAANNANTSYATTASATYAVGSGLSETVATDAASYTRSQTVTITAKVSAGGTPVANASVSFTITKANGSMVTQSVTTNASGLAVFKLRLKRQDPLGAYQAKADAKSNGLTANAATSFSVK